MCRRANLLRAGIQKTKKTQGSPVVFYFHAAPGRRPDCGWRGRL